MPNRTLQLRCAGLLIAALASVRGSVGMTQETAAAPATARGPLALRIRGGYLEATRAHAPADLPIGVFDSGTGGLAVLEAILRLDEHDNQSHAARPGGDGQLDFAAEQFVFLADQANMPYGNYPAVGKKSFLVELILNDAAFLLGTDYSRDAQDAALTRDKSPAKTIVIACNTATANGKGDIESLLDLAEIDAPVVNVIDAGAQGAVESLLRTRGGAVGVLATVGTVGAGAYPAAIQALAQRQGLGRPPVVQQGSVGLAGAIDEMPEFLARDATAPRGAYRGPSLSHATARIDPALLPRYDFDFTAGRMLWEGDARAPSSLQINSVDNHVAYEMVSLLERVRRDPAAQPLSVVVLGCTHFPYCLASFRNELRRLRDYQEEGQFIYRPWIREDVQWVDPATITARQLYLRLAAARRLRTRTDMSPGGRGEFYITVPDARRDGVRVDASGGFTYEYKYGRSEGLNFGDVRVVPLTPRDFPAPTTERLRRQLPAVWRLLGEFAAHNPKAAPTHATSRRP